MIKNILFDLDGTIIDSSEGIMKAFKYALEYFNIKVDDNSIRKLIGIPINEMFSRTCDLKPEQIEIGIKKYREYYSTKGISENSLYDGMKELLIDLKNEGKRLIIATSKPAVYAEKILEEQKIKDCFDFISGATLDGSRRKKEDVIAYAINNIDSIKLEECIMIGDRSEDIKGAKSNNIKSIGVTYGFGTKEELSESNADYIVTKVDDIKRIVITEKR